MLPYKGYCTAAFLNLKSACSEWNKIFCSTDVDNDKYTYLNERLVLLSTVLGSGK